MQCSASGVSVSLARRSPSGLFRSSPGYLLSRSSSSCIAIPAGKRTSDSSNAFRISSVVRTFCSSILHVLLYSFLFSIGAGLRLCQRLDAHDRVCLRAGQAHPRQVAVILPEDVEGVQCLVGLVGSGAGAPHHIRFAELLVGHYRVDTGLSLYVLENLLQRAPFGTDVAVALVLRYCGFLRSLAASSADLLVQFPLEKVETLGTVALRGRVRLGLRVLGSVVGRRGLDRRGLGRFRVPLGNGFLHFLETGLRLLRRARCGLGISADRFPAELGVCRKTREAGALDKHSANGGVVQVESSRLFACQHFSLKRLPNQIGLLLRLHSVAVAILLNL